MKFNNISAMVFYILIAIACYLLIYRSDFFPQLDWGTVAITTVVVALVYILFGFFVLKPVDAKHSFSSVASVFIFLLLVFFILLFMTLLYDPESFWIMYYVNFFVVPLQAISLLGIFIYPVGTAIPSLLMWLGMILRARFLPKEFEL